MSFAERRRRGAVRVGMISLGCAKNLVDSEVMLGHLERAGATFVTNPAEAEVIIVNTCGFIGPAREESISTILDAARYREEGNLQRLVVTGCMVQRYAREMRKSLPEVDVFLGLDELDHVVAAVRGPMPREAAEDFKPSRYLYDHFAPRRRATPPWTAYVKIAEGCDHTCSFCAIPTFRGRFRSRDPQSVVAEARALAASGVAEVNLIAQDSSHYGRDRGDLEGLAHLLEELDRVEGLRWIRLHYLYPNTVTDRLIDAMARLPKVVPYVDIPLQHAHADTLKRMRRGGSAERHLKLLERFRRAMPEAALRTTLIVGFPGETQEEFEELKAFVREARFDYLGVFTYSHEESTGAYAFDDDVAEDEKQRRRDEIMRLQQRIAFQNIEKRLPRTEEVLVEGLHPDTELLLVGRLKTQAPDVDGQVLIHDGFASPGAFVDVELTERAGYDIVGRVVGRPLDAQGHAAAPR